MEVPGPLGVLDGAVDEDRAALGGGAPGVGFLHRPLDRDDLGGLEAARFRDSLRVRPYVSCPARAKAAATADPMKPVAPVTKTLMGPPPGTSG